MTGPLIEPHVALKYLYYPRLVLALCVIFIIAASTQLGAFKFDASSDTLVVEGDPDLVQFEHVVETFGGEDFLFLTFAPTKGDPFSGEALKQLQELTSGLSTIDGVSGVFSILDAPLLKSPPVEITSLLDGFPTLTSAGTDVDLARDELANSPFFRELLVSRNGEATAIKIDISRYPTLSKEEAQQKRSLLIERIRDLQTEFSSVGRLHLGGVPMISVDMIAYVKSDLQVFGGVVLILMIVALALFFQRLRWVVLPVVTASAGVVLTVGLLGGLAWQATVISSNFVSLLSITTISLTIHLIVHFRLLRLTRPELDVRELVYATMNEKFLPCLYTALTTIAAFGSLTVSGILPVESFGWMMCLGIVISFLVTYTIFPAILLLLPLNQVAPNLGQPNSFIRSLGELARWRPMLLTFVSLGVAITAFIGIGRVTLDNRFAEYFDADTEIYQGMRYIDENLGGTIPFDVILRFPAYEDTSFDEFDDDFGGEDDFFSDSTETYPERYWYARDMLDRLELVHRYVDTQPHVGKVLSLTALEDFARDFTGGEKLSSLEIVAILGAIPDDLHRQIIDPYANPRSGELRISGRIVESGPEFDREKFRQDIEQFAVTEAGFAQDQVVVTGMMVLFHGMLAKLLDSQINTLAYILLVVFVMFLVLLRSLRHALLGLIPNVLASATVIGAMGFAGVPLDIMTTTVAAVCIGIGVDNTIHYLHRFEEEYALHGDARIAVSFCHERIGRALYYTSFTVVIGFSVLAFSSFVPTVMFGVWTAVAMLLALLANLTLLPALLVLSHASKPTEPKLRDKAV